MRTVIGHITLWISTSDQISVSEMATKFTNIPDIKLVGLCVDENAAIGLISVNDSIDRDPTFKGRYHITIAINYGILPTYACRLLEYSNFDVLIEPIQLHGVLKQIN